MADVFGDDVYAKAFIVHTQKFGYSGDSGSPDQDGSLWGIYQGTLESRRASLSFQLITF
ncbi:hypothetical protein C1645_822739 [Glomus cerebriforme]|uniref:Uncharacterized protein n=1 Tax=Glomus cerebriforme TaxID=658196 RepID=A0A397T7A4_9GLOM|nr:hypothetical protein C1645_822739 [Glomus cerebriforme]